MVYAMLRYLIPLLALFAAGPLAGRLTGALRGHDGGPEASLLVGATPMAGVTAGLGVMALAIGVGLLGARTIGHRMGLFCAGLVVAWAAWGTGRVDLILTQPHADGALRTLALEGLLLGVVAAAGALAILRMPVMAMARPETRDPNHEHHHLTDEPTVLADSTAPLALGAAVLAAGIVVWLLAQETLKGQTIAATTVGGLAAASAARVAAHRVSAVWVFVGLAILAAGGPLAASLLHAGSGEVARNALAGRLFVLARPLPLDWVAGAFLGVPIGLAWASSMVERETAKG